MMRMFFLSNFFLNDKQIYSKSTALPATINWLTVRQQIVDFKALHCPFRTQFLLFVRNCTIGNKNNFRYW